MVQCPNCSHQIDQEFGMVTCPECQAVFMIDFSGNVEISDGTATPSEEPLMDEPLQETALEPEEPSVISDINPQDTFDMASDYETEAEDYIPEEEEPLEESPETELETATEESFDAEEPFESGYEEVAPMAAAVPIPDNEPVDVTEFANSEDSLMEDGYYLYNLSIDRIDSKEQRETVKYVLGDLKLKLDLNEVMSHFKNGRLVILDLHPLKAKRIIEQLQYFDFDIRWEQKLVVLEDEVTEMDIDADADI